LNGKTEKSIPREHTAELGRAIPSAQMIEVEGTGHEQFIQKPNKVNQIILNFLKDPCYDFHLDRYRF